MQKTLSPSLKGLITAALMIGLVMGIYYAGDEADQRLQYGIYLIYLIGIAWTLIAYRRSEAFTGSFGGLFNQGFKCFIVVTLAMVIFTGIFNKMHPEFAEESANLYRVELNKRTDILPGDIEPAVNKYRKQYPMTLVYGAIFGYLIIGVVTTLFIAAFLFLTRRKK